MRLPAWICALGLAAGGAAGAAEGAHVGEVVPSPVLRAVGGGRQALLAGGAAAHVLVFVRPNQDHSVETLAALTTCAERFGGKPVRWVAVVSSGWSDDVVRGAVAASRTPMPVLVDEGDALYGRLGVRVHPTIAVTDARGRLVAWEPFHKVNQCDRLAARVARALGEADDAAVALADQPPPGLFPNQIEGAVANRHVRMGEKFFRAGLYARAAEEARLVLEGDPRHAGARLLLADALAAQGSCRDTTAPRLACAARP